MSTADRASGDSVEDESAASQPPADPFAGMVRIPGGAFKIGSDDEMSRIEWWAEDSSYVDAVTEVIHLHGGAWVEMPEEHVGTAMTRHFLGQKN